MLRVNLSPLTRARKIAQIVVMTLRRTRQAAKLGRKPDGRVDKEGMALSHLRWSDDLIRILGIDLKIQGEPVSSEPCLFLSNHVSYLDIPMIMQFVNRGNFGVYVSKAEVKNWPIFGDAATVGGTIYVNRRSRHSRQELSDSIGQSIQKEGHSVVIFPEGTSSIEVKSFKAGPFLAAVDHGLRVQPLCIHYKPLRDCAFIDDDALMPHLWNLSGYERPEVTLVALPPRRITDPEADAKTMREEVRTIFRELEAKAQKV